ncbi:MAG: alpha/beta fold hydrolase [Bacteriovoracia bacterium]
MSNTSPILNEHGYFRTRDGVRVYYSVEGPKGAPPLLFCYGLVCSKLQWKYQMEKFRATHRVIYMDYRGHGQSARPEDASTVTIENLARDLVTLMDELEIDSAPVLGHSLGVNIILDLYRIAPKRVKALVLANGTPKDPFETMFHHNFLQVFFPAIRKLHGFFPEALGKFWRSQGTNPINQEFIALAGFNPKYAKREDINEYLRLTSTVDLDIFMNLLGDFMKHDSTHWLHEVKVPTLVIAGQRDLITPPLNQRIFAQLVPGAEFHEVKEGSHCPQMEKPDEVNALLARFLSEAEKMPAKKNPKVAAKKNGKKSISRPRGRAVQAD